MSRQDEKIPSVISGKRSEYSNCCCDMCHGLDYVAKIKYPITNYYKATKYRELQAEYHEIWICDECRKKLIGILEECNV